MLEEKKIVSQILQGDMQAFEQIVKRNEKLVFSIIYRLVDKKQDAEDICQEVFIKVYRGLGSFSFESKLSTWIAKIAYLTSINHLRKSGNATGFHSVDHLADFEFSGDTPDIILEKKNINSYLLHLIDQLPPAYKTVITLYHIHQLSYDEIKDVTGMPDGTVKVYLLRARKLLKQKVEAFLKTEIA